MLLVLYAVAYSIFVMTGFGVENFATSVALRVSLFGRGWSFLLGGLAAGLYVRHGAAWRRALAPLPWLARGGGDGLVLLVLGAMGLLLMKVETIGTWRAEIEWLPWHIPESALWAAFILGVLVLPLVSRDVAGAFQAAFDGRGEEFGGIGAREHRCDGLDIGEGQHAHLEEQKGSQQR